MNWEKIEAGKIEALRNWEKIEEAMLDEQDNNFVWKCIVCGICSSGDVSEHLNNHKKQMVVAK